MALRRHHMNAFLNLAPLQRHSQEGLQEFIDHANNHLLALKALGEPVDSWDFLAVSLLSRKLDQATLRDWEKQISQSSAKETFGNLIQFP